jgi:hypothetical protein
MKVTIEEAVWTVSRQPPPAGWRAKGEQLQPHESGLWFHSNRGEARFLPLDSAQLPTQAQLDAMPLDQLAALWQRGTKR